MAKTKKLSAEDIESEFSKLYSYFSDMRTAVNNINHNLETTDDNIKWLNSSFSLQQKQLGTADERISFLEALDSDKKDGKQAKLTDIYDRITYIEKKIAEIRLKISDNKKEHLQQFEELNSVSDEFSIRLDKLEANIAEYLNNNTETENYEVNSQEIALLQSEISFCKKKLSAQDEMIAKMQDTIILLTKEISNLSKMPEIDSKEEKEPVPPETEKPENVQKQDKPVIEDKAEENVKEKETENNTNINENIDIDIPDVFSELLDLAPPKPKVEATKKPGKVKEPEKSEKNNEVAPPEKQEAQKPLEEQEAQKTLEEEKVSEKSEKLSEEFTTSTTKPFKIPAPEPPAEPEKPETHTAVAVAERPEIPELMKRFVIPQTPGIVLFGNNETPETLKVKLFELKNLDEILECIDNFDNVTKTRYSRCIDSYCARLDKAMSKIDFSTVKENEISVQLSSAFFKIVSKYLIEIFINPAYNIIKNNRGREEDAKLYEELLVKINAYLTKCCIYTRKMDFSKQFDQKFLDVMNIRRVPGLNPLRDGLPFEVKRLPYCMSYLDPTGRRAILLKQGAVDLYEGN